MWFVGSSLECFEQEADIPEPGTVVFAIVDIDSAALEMYWAVSDSERESEVVWVGVSTGHVGLTEAMQYAAY